MKPHHQQFIDHAVDAINSFHRDERKVQAKKTRTTAVAALDRLDAVLAKKDQIDMFFVPDEGRKFGRAILVAEYGEETVTRALGPA